MADSRSHIGRFRNVIVKVNREEAFEAVSRYSGTEGTVSLSRAIRSMVTRTGQPVYVTLGPDGILCDDGEATHHVPGIPVPDPIDIVGAGDSVSAGIVSALCAGASSRRCRTRRRAGVVHHHPADRDNGHRLARTDAAAVRRIPSGFLSRGRARQISNSTLSRSGEHGSTTRRQSRGPGGGCCRARRWRLALSR